MKHLITITLFIVTLMLSGCGEKLPAGMPKPYPVTINIIQDGKPLADASVALMPKEALPNGYRWNAVGRTDSWGNARVRTEGKYDGAVPGGYQVMISKFVFEDNNGRMEGFQVVDIPYTGFSTPESMTVEQKSNRKSIDVGKAVKVSADALP
ncbi:MAG: hypothetical protein LBT46_11470 [Planctomycetaceae bacterium]|jgi:hypothetical protein|nr:hypothetical protein [Planctomycetaceae bacterium]